MISLSMGQFTALDVGVLEYIDIAKSVGCQTVSLLVKAPGDQADLPITTRDNLEAVKQKLAETGLQVLNAECFMLTPNTEVAEYRPVVALARELGAVGVTALLYDPDAERAKSNLVQLCQLAAEYGLGVNIEFMPLGAQCHSLAETVRLIQSLDQPGLGIALDLLHLIRSGETPDDVAAVPAELISYVQLCDSADVTANNTYGEEAGGNRLAPGDGQFPIVAFLQALPSGVPIELEVPQPPGMPAKQRIDAIFAATRREIERAGLS